MNERIKLLAEQADIVFGFDKNGDPEVICSNIDIEKFAELIVRECAFIGELYADGNYDVPRKILARFGMNEEEE